MCIRDSGKGRGAYHDVIECLGKHTPEPNNDKRTKSIVHDCSDKNLDTARDLFLHQDPLDFGCWHMAPRSVHYALVGMAHFIRTLQANLNAANVGLVGDIGACLLYTSPSPRDR